MTEDEKKTALEFWNYFEYTMKTFPPKGYAMEDFFPHDVVETIRKALGG